MDEGSTAYNVRQISRLISTSKILIKLSDFYFVITAAKDKYTAYIPI